MTSTDRMSLGTSIALAALVIALFGWLRADIGDMRADIDDLRGEMRTEFKADMEGLRRSVSRLDDRIVGVENRMARVEGLVEGLRPSLAVPELVQ